MGGVEKKRAREEWREVANFLAYHIEKLLADILIGGGEGETIHGLMSRILRGGGVMDEGGRSQVSFALQCLMGGKDGILANLGKVKGNL